MPQWLKTWRTSMSVTNQGLRSIHGAGLEQLGIAREACESIDAEGLRDAGDCEQQPDARARDEVLNAVEAAIAGEFRDK